MKVKICGLTTKEDVALMRRVCPNYAGVVLFYPKSKRNRTLQQAEEIVKSLPDSVKSVAVTVSPTLEQAKQIEEIGFDVIQVHGELRGDVLSETALPIWRAFNGTNLDELDFILNDDRIAGIVFDAAQPGSGKVFDWKQLPDFTKIQKLCILAGGLTPSNVRTAIETVHPDVVDVSSGVEFTDASLEGKDPEKVEDFVNSARAQA